MHVCFVAIDFHGKKSGGGIASYVHTLATELSQLGHHVSVLVGGKTRRWQEQAGYRVLFWPMGQLHWYLYRTRVFSSLALPLREFERSSAVYQALKAIHRDRPIDLVEGCESGNLFVSRLGIPCIIRLHGEPYVFARFSGEPVHWGLRTNRRLEYIALRRAAGVTSPSEFQAHTVATDLGWPAKRIVTIPNPVAPRFLEAATDQCLPPGPDDNLVLYTGRIEYRKGILPWLRSLPEVAARIPDVKYVIAGGRHNSISTEMLQAELAHPEVGARTVLLGHIPWDELVAWYRRARLFVMPSYYETFGISCLEAMAFGLPVVATKAGGLPEVVEDGVTGLLVPPGDEQALAQAITRLLLDPDLSRRMGQAGRAKVLSEYTAGRVTQETLCFYQTILTSTS